MRLSACNWLLLFFILWLPIQGTAAAVLSVCAEEKSLNSHHDKKLMITNDDHHRADCHKQQATENPIDHVLASVACDDTFCDAYSNTPIVSSYVVARPIDTIPAVFTLNSSIISFIPEQPQRPPLYFTL